MANQIDSSSANDLIVDFPREGRPTTSQHNHGHTSTESTHHKSNPSAVHFSPTSQLIEYSSSPKAKHNKWYSEEDELRFKLTLFADRYRVARMLISTPFDRITQEDLYEAIGLEKHLSPGVEACVRQDKRKHVRIILAEQRRQQGLGSQNDEVLSFVSRKSSEWSRERAHKLAAGDVWSI